MIDLEEDGAAMLSNQEENCIKQVSHLFAFPSRWLHLSPTWLVHTFAAEEEQEASGRRDENNEQEAHQLQTTDRGKLYTNNKLTAQENGMCYTQEVATAS